MNVIVFRTLIVFVVLVHVAFVSIGSAMQYGVEPPVFILPSYLWYAVYILLLVSLIGMFFMFKITRLSFLVAVILGLGIVATQGGVVQSAFENVLVQLGSGLYGGIIAMAYFGNLEWRERLTKRSTPI